MLERLFSDKKHGFYVDVGAWDPNAYSVTRHFYERGWRGLNIEPIAWRHAMFEEQRPRDINLHCLVGSSKGPARFFECVEEDYLSTTVVDIADAMRAKGQTIKEYDVAVDRLDTLIEQNCPKTIDFLKLDVEGAEADVLATLDLRRVRPIALIIEATIPGSGLKSWDEPNAYGSWDEWEESVISQGYVFARFDGLNRFYIRREDEKLARRLSLPPGIFDGIDPSQLAQASAAARLETIEQQSGEMAVLLGRAEAAENWVAQHEQHRIASQERIDSLTAELAARSAMDGERETAAAAVMADAAARMAELAGLLAAAQTASGEQAVAAQLWTAAGELDRATQADLSKALHEQLETMRSAADKFEGGLARVVADAADSNQKLGAAAEKLSNLEALTLELREQIAEQSRQHSAHLLDLTERLQTTENARLQLEQDIKAMEDVADQRLSELRVGKAREEALDRQLADARQAILVFEQWFDRLPAQSPA